jgi:hypothetical protein
MLKEVAGARPNRRLQNVRRFTSGGNSSFDINIAAVAQS